MSNVSVTTPFDALNNHSYISLTTFRKNGQPVATPVWFAQSNGKLYIFTITSAGKIKRLKHTSRVTVAPCTMSGKVVGDALNAHGRILETAEERHRADQALTQKYGWQKRVFFFLYRLQGQKESDRTYIEFSSEAT